MVKFRVGLVAMSLAVLWPGPAQAAPANPASPGGPDDGRFRISLLTMGPGQPIYTMWGHTALRVQDTKTGRDLVFDFGRFRFDHWFVLRFLKGDPVYRLGLSRWARLKERYRRRGRVIYGQRLYFPDKQTRQLVSSLARMSMPANNGYVYNHYTNNCTTAYRDRIDNLLKGDLRRFSSKVHPQRTLRKATLESARNHPLSRVGMGLIINRRADQPVSRWDEMFKPLVLMHTLRDYRKSGRPGAKLIGPRVVLLKGNRNPASISNTVYFWLALIGFALLFVLPVVAQSNPVARGLGTFGFYAWCIAGGLAGAILLALWLGSSYRIFHANWNLLGLHPLLLAWPVLDRRLQDHKHRIGLALALAATPLLGLGLHLLGAIDQAVIAYLAVAAAVQMSLLVQRWRQDVR